MKQQAPPIPHSPFARYRAVAAITLRAQTAYRFDVWLGTALPFLRVFLSWALWTALFQGRTTLGGFTFEQMIAYSVLTAFLSRLNQTNALVWETADDIREGRFTKYLTKPINPFGHFLAVAGARTGYVLAVAIGSVAALALLFGNREVPPAGPAAAAAALATAALGLVFLAATAWLTAALAWKFTDITGFHLIRQTVVEFLAGSFLPLSMFSEPVQAAMKVLPFYYVQFLPVSLWLGRRTEEAVPGLLVLSAWTIGALCLGDFAWRRLRLLDEGVGG